MSAMLPDLGRLALLHAHEEEEEVPTGVLDSAIGKASHKKRRWLAKWKQDEAARPRLEGLPLELRQLVTDQLVAKNAGDCLALCAELEAWCRAHPIACTKAGLWEAAFEAAFGRLNPRSADVLLFSKAFGVFPPERGGGPLPWKAMFVELCKALGQLDPSQARVYAHMASWTDAQLDHYCFYQRIPHGEQTSAQKQLYALLELKGASFIRRAEHIELARAALVDYNVADVRSMIQERDLDVDYVLPVIPDLRLGLPSSLLLRLVRTNSYFNPNGVAMVKVLLEGGADPNGLDVHGHRMASGTLHWTVRHAGTAWSSALEQVKLLLAAGADPTAKARVTGTSQPVTPRELAVIRYVNGPGQIIDQSAKELVRVLDEAIAARAAAAGAAPAV